MPTPYSLDLRKRVVVFVESRSFAARICGAFWRVGFVRCEADEELSTNRKPGAQAEWWSTSFQTRPASRVSVGSPDRRSRISPCRSWLPSWPQPVISKLLLPRSRAGSSETATASKKTLLASEQDRPDIRSARQEWQEKRQPRMRLEPHRLVFIDETGTTTKMARLRGRCLKGRRLRAKAPFGHWKT